MQKEIEKQDRRNIPKSATTADNSVAGVSAKGPDPGLQRNLSVIQASSVNQVAIQAVGTRTGNPVQQKKNKTGMPDEVKERMESTLGADFSDVKIHSSSSKAPQIGALAYAQGNEVHFAPGHYNPASSAGQSLLGHELTHVVQQRQGRVKPTTEIGGMPVNDNPALEQEADDLGRKV